MESLALDFMNSDWSDYRGSGRRDDRLRRPEWRAEFLGRWQLDPSGAPSPKVLESLTDLRAALWRVVEAISRDRAPSGGDLDAINDALGAATPRRRIVADGETFRIDLVPARRDWQWVRSEIAADFAALLVEHEPSRIKTCENDDCRWVFYDESKGQSRRWCESVCSTLMRVRRFRERHRETTTAGGLE